MTLRIEAIQYSEAAFASILAEAERADGAFMLRVRDEWVSGAQRFDRPGEFLLGVFDGERLVAVGGVSNDPYSAEPGLGRVRHVYVLEALRRQGIARMLMNEIIARARGHFTLLRLRTRSSGAAALYENLGFVRVDRDDETHRLTLR